MSEEQFQIEFIKEAAKIQLQQAFCNLQIAVDPNDRFAFADEMDLWKSVITLIDQREKMLFFIEKGDIDLAKNYVKTLKNQRGSNETESGH